MPLDSTAHPTPDRPEPRERAQPSDHADRTQPPGDPGGRRRRPVPGSWGDLFDARHLPAALVLSGGVAMYATNVYVTAALLPSALAEFGGAEYFAWAATAFLTASVISSMLVARVVARVGASGAYVGAFLVFTAGTLVNLVAPSMEILILGRAVQGLGGGLLAGLGYAVIRTALPERLWTRAAGLVSAMWGVGNLLGPALGGLFAELGAWRAAFGLLAVLALALAWVSRRAMPRGGEPASEAPPIAVPSLVLLALAAASFSVTAVLPRGAGMALGLGISVLVLLTFVARERYARLTVLPQLTYRRGNGLKWVYLTLGLLSAGAMTEAFIPLFGQQLAGLSPWVAGFLGAALSIGWTAAQLCSVNLVGLRSRRVAIAAGPALLAVGLFAAAALFSTDADGWRVLAWAAALFAAGCGIGVAFPHLSVAALRSTDDPAEGAKAAAGVSTTQLIANAVSSAIVGVLVAAGGPGALGSAQAMAVGIGVAAVIGVATAAAAIRSVRR